MLQIRNPDPDPPKEMHPKILIFEAICEATLIQFKNEIYM